MKKITKRILGTSLLVPVILFAVFWLIFVKCKTQIHPDLQPYVDEFKEHYEFYLDREFPEHHIIVDFVGDENSDCTYGDCYEYPLFYLKCAAGCANKTFYQYYLFINKSEICYRKFKGTKKEGLYLKLIVFHELAHLFLDTKNREYYDDEGHFNTRFGVDKIPSSIMHSNQAQCVGGNNIIDAYKKNESYYLHQLFLNEF